MAYKRIALKCRGAYIAITVFCCLLSYIAVAQSKVQGTVLNNNGEPLANASVLLLNSADSSLVKGMMTAKEGRFSFDKVASGSYLVTSTFVGFKQVYSNVFVANNQPVDLPPLRLSQKEEKLSGVTVAARKPLIEQTIDRLVINVAGNIVASGSTALDILERSPGVIVDRQNNSISINGKDGVVVMMNGRLTRMPVSALVPMLEGMPADKVEKIELITTPPANLDAEGNAGYINIVLKRNTQYGTNGSYSITAGYSRGAIAIGTINFNHRKGRFNLYGDYSYNREHSKQYFAFYHAVTNQGKFMENFSESDRRPMEDFHDGKIGLDYDLNKKTVIGALLTIYNRRWIMDAWNNSAVYTNMQLDTLVDLSVYEFHPTSSYDINVNLQQTYKEGNKLTVNLDYMHYMDRNPVDYTNNYYDSKGMFLRDEQLKSNKTTPINLWVAAVDYTKKLNKKFDWEAGAKTTISKFKNVVQIERLQHDVWTTDDLLSATYRLNESIAAAYSSLLWTIDKKTKMKLGLRFEHTNSNLGTEKEKNIVDRHYGRLFPSFFLSHTIDEHNTANFTYSRRITRPTFWNLAPFVIFMDPNTYFSGNPGLQPSIGDNVNLSYTYKKKILSVALSYEADPITNFSPRIDSLTNKETLAAENQDNRKTVTVSLSIPATITKWWNLQLNLNGSIQQINGRYNDQPLSIGNKSFFLSGQQNFTFPKEFTLSLSGFYRTAGLFGIYKFKSIGSLDIGIQKKLTALKSSLRLNFSNILNTMVYKPEIDQPDKNLIAKAELIFSRPAVKFTFTRTFGNEQVKGKRNRSSGTEEEKDRLRL
jgi:outer membrane receptor protein involved in Fe transport